MLYLNPYHEKISTPRADAGDLPEPCIIERSINVFVPARDAGRSICHGARPSDDSDTPGGGYFRDRLHGWDCRDGRHHCVDHHRAHPFAETTLDAACIVAGQ